LKLSRDGILRYVALVELSHMHKHSARLQTSASMMLIHLNNEALQDQKAQQHMAEAHGWSIWLEDMVRAHG